MDKFNKHTAPIYSRGPHMVQRSISWVFACLFFCAVALSSAQASLAAPILINTVSDLENISNNPYGNYLLGSNINASGFNFTPIPVFRGVFDGNGHTISNLNIVANEAGLFRILIGTVRNLGLIDTNITSSISGGSVASSLSGGSIFNSYSTGAVSSGGGVVGGLVGVSVNGTINQSYSTASVVGSVAGGLVGANGGALTQSYALGSVTASGSHAYGGGLVGNQPVIASTINGISGYFVGRIDQSYAAGPVLGVAGAYSGGIAGSHQIGSVQADGNTYTPIISNSNWDIQATNQSTALGNPFFAGATNNTHSLTTVQLQSGSLPSGFDPSVWVATTGQYPYLITNPPSPPTVAPPTILELAKLAQDVYQVPQGINNYTPVTGSSIYGTTGNNGFAATAYKNGNQIVISVRGTDLNNINQAEYNLLSDTSFVTGNPDLILSANVSQLASMVADIASNHPNAKITLTGHSLGAAIAQIVGEAAHIKVTSFDAPGAMNLVPALNDQLLYLASLHIPTQSSQIINYRLYGDQVSLVGNQIGSSITVGNTLSNFLTDLQLGSNPMSFQKYHSLATLITQIDNGATQTAGQPGLNITPLLVVAYKAIQVAVGEQQLTFTILVLDIAAQVLLDPPAGTSYLLQAREGSPYFKSVTLPYFENVSAWDFQYHTEQGWSASEVITSMGEFDFGLGVDAIKFIPLDSLFDPTYIADSFAFGVTFASTGTFEGTVTAFNNTKSVPESPTLPLFLLALLALLVSRRTRLLLRRSGVKTL